MVNIMQIFKIEQVLSGIKYPVEKQQIIKFAKDQGVPGEIAGMLEKIPDGVYNSANDVLKKIKQIK